MVATAVKTFSISVRVSNLNYTLDDKVKNDIMLSVKSVVELKVRQQILICTFFFSTPRII